jgi:hypothetical protein
MSITLDVASESNKVVVFKDVEPNWRVIESMKLVVDDNGCLGP